MNDPTVSKLSYRLGNILNFGKKERNLLSASRVACSKMMQ